METKENKGVTLIALAVTIIVMLILAGVTISALAGNSGITTKAKQAKMLSEAKTEEEAIRLVVTYTNMQKNIGEENIIYLGEPLHDKDLVSGNEEKFRKCIDYYFLTQLVPAINRNAMCNADYISGMRDGMEMFLAVANAYDNRMKRITELKGELK